MGTNTLETAYSNGQIIDASHVNELTASLLNQFVGRNTSGVPEAGKSLGTAAIPWGAGYFNSLTLGGKVVDPDTVTTVANKIVSGRTRALSQLPDFIEVDALSPEFVLKGADTNLLLSINGTAVTVSTDITKTGLTTAPSTGNTALLNRSDASGQYNTRYIGEDGFSMAIDTLGSEWTSRIGQFIAFKIGTSEIALGYLKSSTEITNVYRGFYFDESRAPIVRETMSNNATLTLMNIGWVFVEDNGTTVDVSYRTPVYQYEAPSSPQVGDYWYDIPNQVWKRYSGTEFEIINRMIVGQVVLDDTAAIGYRCLDFTNNFSPENNIQVVVEANEVVQSLNSSNKISVYGGEVIQDNNVLDWNITQDLEGGLVEANNTLYYLYISEQGQRIISDEKPHFRNDLKGDYHPYHSWRMVGIVYNNGSGDFEAIYSEFGEQLIFSGNSGDWSTGSTGFVDVNNQAVTMVHRGLNGSYIDIRCDGSFGANTSNDYSVLVNLRRQNLIVSDDVNLQELLFQGKSQLGFAFCMGCISSRTSVGVGVYRFRVQARQSAFSGQSAARVFSARTMVLVKNLNKNN